MNDPISRQAAINDFNNTKFDVGYCTEYGEGYNDGIDFAVSKLSALPSVQSGQKRGKWINDKGLYKCSCCNQLWTEWWAISKPIEQMNKDMPYCPMCGSYNGEKERATDDLISRQAAIDALCDNCDHGQAVCPHYPCKQFIAIAETLPSVQPEIIRCKDCKWFGDIGCAIRIVDDSDKPTENDFCSFAERRE